MMRISLTEPVQIYEPGDGDPIAPPVEKPQRVRRILQLLGRICVD